MNLLLPWLWDTPSKELPLQHLHLSLTRGLGGEEERVVFGLVIHPAAAEQAHGFVGRRREGKYDSSCVDGVAWEILVHLILSHSFFEQLY